MFARILIATCCLLCLVQAAVSQLPGRPPLRPQPVDPDLILSYVTVTASKNAQVPRLSARDFQIFEDNKEQKIDYFLVQDQPVTVGLLWAAGTAFDDPAPDPEVRECPKVFMKNMVPGSEYFLLQGDRVTTSYTTDISKIPSVFAWSGGSTDTIYVGLDVLKEAANPRKMLLLIGEAGGGGQLQSDYVEKVAIKLSAGAQSTQIHSLSFSTDGDQSASIFLSEVVDLTGGSYNMVQPSSVNCANLAKELRVQYLIGYHPTNNVKDGKWRKLRVEVRSPEEGPKLKGRIKRGYYATKN